MTKSEIRKLMFEKRNQANLDDLQKSSSDIIKKIQEDPNYKKSKLVAIFYPMEREVNLLGLLKDQKLFCFPKVTQDGLHFYQYNPNQTFVQSKFGVMEPEGGLIVDDHIDFMCAPALAISKEHYRIGYGKGYYDQFIAKHRPNHITGVIFKFQEFDELPYDSFDQKLDDYIKG
jgi:5-formyltetrahydrofolate cyclo-ligase